MTAGDGVVGYVGPAVEHSPRGFACNWARERISIHTPCRVQARSPLLTLCVPLQDAVGCWCCSVCGIQAPSKSNTAHKQIKHAVLSNLCAHEYLLSWQQLLYWQRVTASRACRGRTADYAAATAACPIWAPTCVNLGSCLSM